MQLAPIAFRNEYNSWISYNEKIFFFKQQINKIVIAIMIINNKKLIYVRQYEKIILNAL